jgi:hypothetical protein
MTLGEVTAPLWVTVLVGVASGLAGTLVTISHERSAELRSRKLAAAEDFVAEVGKLVNALSRPAGVQFSDNIAAMKRATNLADIAIVRLVLLFGSRSGAVFDARKIIEDAEYALDLIEGDPTDQSADHERAISAAIDDVLRGADTFCGAAMFGARHPWLARRALKTKAAASA